MRLGRIHSYFEASGGSSLKHLDSCADIEILARMAARHAGRDPDERVEMTLAGEAIFNGLIWRYPDFLTRAEAAYEALTKPNLTLPPGVDIRQLLSGHSTHSRAGHSTHSRADQV
jgi:hypothetical protein